MSERVPVTPKSTEFRDVIRRTLDAAAVVSRSGYGGSLDIEQNLRIINGERKYVPTYLHLKQLDRHQDLEISNLDGYKDRIYLVPGGNACYRVDYREAWEPGDTLWIRGAKVTREGGYTHVFRDKARAALLMARLAAKMTTRRISQIHDGVSEGHQLMNELVQSFDKT